MPVDTHPAPILIGDRSVGARCPVFIIAEAGVNHGGSLEAALALVDAAAQAGADAVKFQLFRADELTVSGAPTASYQRRSGGPDTQRALLQALELSLDGFDRIRLRCRERSILFLATPFGTRQVEELVALGAPAIKIASTDLTNPPLLKAVTRTSLPIIASTGASTVPEMDAAVELLDRGGARGRLVLLHCVSSYPTPLDALNLGAIGELGRRYGVPCGLSDHTTSTETGGWAAAAGACVLEKHLTLDHDAPGPDNAMSLTPEALSDYVQAVRRSERAMGTGELGMTDLEADVRRVAGRSVVAATSICSGDTITRDMLLLKRPGTGLPAEDLARVAGRTAACDIPADTLMAWDMVR